MHVHLDVEIIQLIRLRHPINDICQLLHVSATRCHLQGVIIKNLYTPTCQSSLGFLL